MAPALRAQKSGAQIAQQTDHISRTTYSPPLLCPRGKISRRAQGRTQTNYGPLRSHMVASLLWRAAVGHLPAVIASAVEEATSQLPILPTGRTDHSSPGSLGRPEGGGQTRESCRHVRLHDQLCSTAIVEWRSRQRQALDAEQNARLSARRDAHIHLQRTALCPRMFPESCPRHFAVQHHRWHPDWRVLAQPIFQFLMFRSARCFAPALQICVNADWRPIVILRRRGA